LQRKGAVAAHERNMSAIIQWSDKLSLGIPEIDGQHKGLIDVINELWHAIVSRKDANYLLGILNKLEQYTFAHFTAEEAVMRVENYPRLRDHYDEHQKFIGHLKGTRAKIENGEEIALELLHFLTDWLVKHIQVSDKDYSNFIAERQRPKSIFARFFGSLRPQGARS